jgi:Domain of unknown function (DUF4386)
VIESNTSGAQRTYARVAGLFYLLVLVFDIAGLVITSSIEGSGGFGPAAGHVSSSETLYRVGLCLALLGSLSTIPLAVGLYVTLRPAEPNLATMGLVFRSAEAAIGGVGIVGSFAILEVYLGAGHSAFDAKQLAALVSLNPLGFSSNIAAIFFSTGSTIFFWAFLKTRYLPRLLAALGVFASALYLLFWFAELVVPSLPGLVSVLASVPILIAEVATGLWLLIVTVRS